mmetsp:Transcript_31915/g.74700  ORF Transcript_31915/g.74700 Transcript_31915/m.74700 type:complete len:823 (+) Transcript_31915:119-2587(+)
MGCSESRCRDGQTPGKCTCCRCRGGVDFADGLATEHAAQIFSADSLHVVAPPEEPKTSSSSKQVAPNGHVGPTHACAALLSEAGLRARQAEEAEATANPARIYNSADEQDSPGRSASMSQRSSWKCGTEAATPIGGKSKGRFSEETTPEPEDDIQQSGLTSEQLRGLAGLMVSSGQDSEDAEVMYEELSGEAKAYEARAEENRKQAAASPSQKGLAPPISIMATAEPRVSAHLQVTIENWRNLGDCYNMAEGILGKGAYGEVRKAHSRGTGLPVAVKSVSKNRAKRQLLRLRSELYITKQLDHPNIVKMCEVFEDAAFVHMVLELCTGGTLHSYVSKKQYLQESESKHLMRQVASGISYLHACRVCHRDMKPGNVLLQLRSPLDMNQLKISDYGLSCIYVPGMRLTAAVGTTDYMAPEVLRRDYDMACDIWSCGVILFLVVCGYLPFRGKDKGATRRRIVRGSMIYREEDWRRVTDACLQVVRRLLRLNVEERFTAKEVLDHAWLAIGNPLPEPSGRLRDAKYLISCLRWLRKLNRFKRAAMHMVASQLVEKQLRGPREAFIWLDVDHDGFVSLEDMRCRHGIHEGDEDLFPEKNGASDITFTEFVAATFDRARYLDLVLCRAVFNAFDSNGDGRISISELSDRQGLLGTLPEQEIEEMALELSDYDEKGMDFDEFHLMMRKDDGKFLNHNLTKSSLGLSDRSSVGMNDDDDFEYRRPPSRGASRTSMDSKRGRYRAASSESIDSHSRVPPARHGWAGKKGASMTKSGTTLMTVVDADSDKAKWNSDREKALVGIEKGKKGKQRFKALLGTPAKFFKPKVTP